MDVPLPEVAGTITDAAAQILSHSFAVYRVEASTAAKIRFAHRTAAKFFHETTTAIVKESSDDFFIKNSKKVFLERYRRVKNGNLYGYNIPLKTKELFRTWYGARSCSKPESNGSNKNDEEGCEIEDFRHQQPWPSNEFCVASFVLAKDLHRLLSECLRQITILDHRFFLDSIYEEKGDIDITSERGLIHSISPPKKRFRSSSDDSHGPFSHKRYLGNRESIESNRDERIRFNLPPFRPSFCPLDFFFYHNQIPDAVNCSEHVDRGALVVVCLTDIPGLEVRSLKSETSSFLCPEVLIHNNNLYRERTDDAHCPDLVCIMAGDQLSRILPSSNMITPPRVCVHRVRNPLKRARLSISYELRLDQLGEVSVTRN